MTDAAHDPSSQCGRLGATDAGGRQHWTGAPFAALFETVGAANDAVYAVALDDYQLEIPTEYLVENEAILADERDGAAMRLRSKGLIRIIFPLAAMSADARGHVEPLAVYSLRSLDVRD